MLLPPARFTWTTPQSAVLTSRAGYQLDGGGADPAAPGVHQDPVPGLDGAHQVQQLVGRQPHLQILNRIGHSYILEN